MKRISNLYEKLISDDNLKLAIFEVNSTHRWSKCHKPNKTVIKVEADVDHYVKELRRIIENGYKPETPAPHVIWDNSAQKEREITIPKIYPDQYIHHALIRVLQPAMMRGMDKWCCGSIRGRGTTYGMNAVKKWMKNDLKGTRYCAEIDIKKFYDSVKPSSVVDRFKHLIKDRKVLGLIEAVTRDGIKIGYYCSQWFANTLLQPLDVVIRNSGVSHYVRYMDNITIFSNRKRTLHKTIELTRRWLEDNGLELKDNYQVFPTSKRLPQAFGYRFGHGYTLLRKRNLLRLTRQLSRYKYKKSHHKDIGFQFASGLISRLGQLRHCSSTNLYRDKVPKMSMRILKTIVRRRKWNTYSVAI